MNNMLLPLLKSAVILSERHGDICYGWQENGFLRLFNEEKKYREILAISYDKMARFLIEEEPNTITALDFDISSSIMSIIRKVVLNTGECLTDARDFFSFCMEFCREKADHYLKMRDILTNHGFDIATCVIWDIERYAIKIIKAKK